ncbi:MAG TPA: inositol monophosphatase [Candidatus Limnocylindrales bacterium]|nr:inositol monophosphatase [Candidatus Limnocylindrales bacterium]
MDYVKFLEYVLTESSKIAASQFGKVKGWAKDGDNQTVLTETDIEIGTFIVKSIEKEFPHDNILHEEAGGINKNSNMTWVADPIDGTSNFAAGVPMYGIMVGLLEGGTPIAGGFALPSFSEIYVAQKRRGATCNGKSIHVTDETDLSKLLVAYGIHAKTPNHSKVQGEIVKSLIPRVLNIRSSASTFDMAMVAKGTYGAFISSRGRIWDCVAPHIVIEEAGGTFTHFDGRTIDYSDPLKNASRQFSYAMGNETALKELTSVVAAKQKDLA